MTQVIRPFNAEAQDYDIAVGILNSVHPRNPIAPGELRHWHESRREGVELFRLIAEDAAGEPVGYGFSGHSSFSFHPERLWIGVAVRPECWGRGIGSALYDALHAWTMERNPMSIRAGVLEDCPAGIRFAEKRGYVEAMREWDSVLDLANYNPDCFEHLGRKALDAGIVIKSLREIMDEGVPDWERRLYEVESVTLADVPFPEPFVPPGVEHWRKMVLESPNFLPEGFFVALDGGEFVGISALWRRQTGDELDTGLTGVLREHRRRGIAMALKLRAARFAKEHGAPRIRTENATTNRPMLAINELLGFAKEPAHIQMMKTLRPETPGAEGDPQRADAS